LPELSSWSPARRPRSPLSLPAARVRSGRRTPQKRGATSNPASARTRGTAAAKEVPLTGRAHPPFCAAAPSPGTARVPPGIVCAILPDRATGGKPAASRPPTTVYPRSPAAQASARRPAPSPALRHRHQRPPAARTREPLLDALVQACLEGQARRPDRQPGADSRPRRRRSFTPEAGIKLVGLGK
jgi:hypothetical protein